MAMSQIYPVPARSSMGGSMGGSMIGSAAGPAGGQSANVEAAVIGGEYPPEPSSTGIGTFQDVLQTAGSYAGSLISSASGVDIGGFQDLIALQLQAQMEMQQVSMISNVEKSRHETRMTPVRNIRVG